MKLFIHDIELSGEDDFAQKFNEVSKAWKKFDDPTLSEDESKAAFEEFKALKLALELGY